MKRTPHNKPTPSKELQILTHLHPRINLSTAEKRKLENLSKGHSGELKFYDLLHEKPSNGRIARFDFLFESNNTEFQIDSLIMNHNTIFHFEIKNFAGDFYVEGDNWHVVGSRKEIRNPLLQLQRAEFLFKQLLQQLNVKMAIKSYIVFVNEEFTLYQSPLAQPIIFPGQLNRFIKMLNSNSRKLTTNHTNLTEKLISLHIDESANSRLPKYDYGQLKKGIICNDCPEFLHPISSVQLKCGSCGSKERLESAVFRSVREFNLLFPERKITVSAIHEWCAVVTSKKTIRRILMKQMDFISKGRSSYYTF